MWLKQIMKHKTSPLHCFCLSPLYVEASPLMRWARVPDTVCPSPAAGGSTSLGRPEPGSPVRSIHQRCWGLACMTPLWPAPPGPNILKPWGRGAVWCGGWTHCFSQQLNPINSGCNNVLSQELNVRKCLKFCVGGPWRDGAVFLITCCSI